MSDIVEQLYQSARKAQKIEEHGVLCLAADEIERLRTECDSLRVDAAELEQENGSLLAVNAALVGALEEAWPHIAAHGPNGEKARAKVRAAIALAKEQKP